MATRNALVSVGRLPLLAALAALVLTLAPAVAPAAERLYWSGSDRDGCAYSFANTAGDHWAFTMVFNGNTTRLPFTEVKRRDEFIEMVCQGPGFILRHRLYKDKLLTQPNDGRWLEMAKGKWRD